MEFKQIRATFTGSESKPVYGLPKKTAEISENPRGSVRALVQMYENRVRENSEESERLSQRNSSVGRLSQDKVSIYEKNVRDSSQEAERISQRNSSVGRLTQDKLQPFLVPPTESNVPTRNRSQTEEQAKGSWLSKLKDSDLETINEKNDKLGSYQNKESVKKYLTKQLENPQDKKLAQKLEIKLEDLMLEQIDEKSELLEKSVREQSPEGNRVEKVKDLVGVKFECNENQVEVEMMKDLVDAKLECNENQVEVEMVKDLVDAKLDWNENQVEVVENEGGARKGHRKRDKRGRSKYRDEVVIEAVGEGKEGLQIVDEQVKEIPEITKNEDFVEVVSKPDKKPSKRRSKRKEKQTIEASPESNEEYFISFHPENKTETYQESPQEFVIYGDYIEAEKVEDPKLIVLDNQEERKQSTFEVERPEGGNENERKKKRKRPHKPEVNEIIVESPDSQQTNPLLKYIVPAPDPFPDPFEQSKKNPLPRAPTLPSNKSSSTPSSDPPPSPFTQDELILKAPKPFSPDPVVPSQVSNFPKSPPAPLITSPYNDFSYKKSPNPIPTEEEDSLKIVILPTLPEDKKSNPPKPQSPIPVSIQFSSIKSGNPFSLDLKSIKPLKKESISELIQEIDITCINCYECLRPEEINSHSFKCLKPNLEITEAMQADIRIKKMLKSISTRKLESEGSKYSLYSRLEEYSVAILEKTMVQFI